MASMDYPDDPQRGSLLYADLGSFYGATLVPDSQLAFAVWIYSLESLVVHVMYAIAGESREGLERDDIRLTRIRVNLMSESPSKPLNERLIQLIDLIAKRINLLASGSGKFLASEVWLKPVRFGGLSMKLPPADVVYIIRIMAIWIIYAPET